MENRTSTVRGLLPPILIGFISIAGICLISLILYFNKPSSDTQQDPTVTPFKFLLLATETEIAATETQNKPAGSPTPVNLLKGIGTKSPTALNSTLTVGQPTNTQITPQATRTAVITFDDGTTFAAGKYDDFDERFIYDGDWSGEFQISGAYEETIAYSTTVGSTISFNFAGSQLQIGYLGETDLGTLQISINGTKYTLDQSEGAEWSSPTLPFATYVVVLTHQDGEQVFFDYITVIGSP